MAARLLFDYGRPWIIGLASLLLAAAIASAASWMFAVAGLMIALVVAPGIMAVLYFAYALKPATAINVLPHIMVFADSEIQVIVEPMQTVDGKPDKAPKVIGFAVAEIKETATRSDGICIYIGTKGFLWVPYYSFESPDSLRQVIDYLREAESRA